MSGPLKELRKCRVPRGDSQKVARKSSPRPCLSKSCEGRGAGQEIEAIEEAIADLIAACDVMRARQELLESIPCVAATTSAIVIAQLPELGARSTSVLKALVGVAPFNADSGGVKGTRHIQGGRAPLRQALYMSAQAGCRCNPVLKAFYETLRARGKSHKQAIIACVGKLVSIMNAIIKTGITFKTRIQTA